MDRNAFAILCDLLKTRGGLLDDGNVTIEEQVATFVNILAHHNKNRSLVRQLVDMSIEFCRALLRLEDVLFVKPTPVPDDCTDSRWRWFKGCLGALDGTYIEVTVPESDKPRGTRYHLQEWADFDRAPRNHEEYFNMKHSQARNIIERCFGLLKKRWAILRSPSFYPIRFQGRMIIACALLHNFIRMYMDVDPEEYTPVTLDDLPIGEDVPNELESIDVVEGSDEWSQWRDDLASEMFDAWR
ncbi:hypothetical protein Dsin_032566 [Dipteronia sinensis]|uniref:DDE Tnp4 domain-containing protein n=1 Tax=Dipteronia sinensis TaxID=43782 RepID=A0AAE0DNW1_9ROSI|nr:hypothetical protein Dsin_032566 [Dipteronia sinensis]